MKTSSVGVTSNDPTLELAALIRNHIPYVKWCNSIAYSLAKLIVREFNVSSKSIDDRPSPVALFNPDDTFQQGN